MSERIEPLLNAEAIDVLRRALRTVPSEPAQAEPSDRPSSGLTTEVATVVPTTVEGRAERMKKHDARLAVRRAVMRGVLKRPSTCSACGVECSPDAHHDNYDYPLEVRWLCRPCHAEHHAGQPRPSRKDGICCPRCDHAETRVVDSRPRFASVTRRRECEACGLRFTTRERVVRQISRPGRDALEILGRRVALLLQSSGLLKDTTRRPHLENDLYV